MQKTIVFFMLITFMFIPPAFSGEEQLPDQITFNEVIMPSSAMLIGEITKSADAAFLASKINASAPKVGYAFATGVSEDKGSFKLGVLMADLKIAFNAGDKEKITTAVRSLATGLVQLGASTALIKSVANLGTAVKAGIDPDAVKKASLPVLEPFIEDFIEKQGKTLYLRIGEWTEAARLAALAGEQGKTEAIAGFIKKINPADYFMTALKDKGAPAGAIASLKILAEMKSAEKIGVKEIKTALKAVDNIIKLMG